MNICFEVICSGKGYAPPDMNNLSRRDRRMEGRREWEGESERAKKRVNFTTRKMRVYWPVVSKGRAPEAKRAEFVSCPRREWFCTFVIELHFHFRVQHARVEINVTRR